MGPGAEPPGGWGWLGAPRLAGGLCLHGAGKRRGGGTKWQRLLPPPLPGAAVEPWGGVSPPAALGGGCLASGELAWGHRLETGLLGRGHTHDIGTPITPKPPAKLLTSISSPLFSFLFVNKH